MKRICNIGLTVSVLLILAAVIVQAATAREPEWLGLPLAPEFVRIGARAAAAPDVTDSYHDMVFSTERIASFDVSTGVMLYEVTPGQVEAYHLRHECRQALAARLGLGIICNQ